MVIGNGLVARTFKRYRSKTDIIIFASGVSNSKETNYHEFEREKKLINEVCSQNINKTIIYFSTISVEDSSQSDSMYVDHKLKMESIIKLHDSFYIFRLPQVVGRTNSPTIIKFLFDCIIENTHFYVNKYSTRNLIHANDIFLIVDDIIKKNIYANRVINVATKINLSVVEIISRIEKITKKKANYDLIDIGRKQYIDTPEIDQIGYIFPPEYIDKTLLKYYNNL